MAIFEPRFIKDAKALRLVEVNQGLNLGGGGAN